MHLQSAHGTMRVVGAFQRERTGLAAFRGLDFPGASTPSKPVGVTISTLAHLHAVLMMWASDTRHTLTKDRTESCSQGTTALTSGYVCLEPLPAHQ